MPATLTSVRTQALKLKPKDRVRLAEEMWASLPRTSLEPITEEILDRRANDILSGKEKGIPAEVAHAKIRKHLLKLARG